MVPLSRLSHLAKRFFGSLSPAGPPSGDESWARSWLLDGEVALWERMSGPDRRHAVGVGRRVLQALGAGVDRPVMAAALLHDVGKIEAGLGTFGRVYATLVGVWRGFVAEAATNPAQSRVGRYLRHDELGARLLAAAGSDPLTVAWAREHHKPRSEWSVPRDIADTLKAADDD